MLAVAGVDSSFWIVPIASVIALAFAWHFYSGMKKEEEGTDVMRKIAGMCAAARSPTCANSTKSSARYS